MGLLTHVDKQNERPRMVDVGDKGITSRRASAQACVRFPEEIATSLKEAGYMTRKGSVITTAQLAGIIGAKQTPQLIPLCHPLALSGCIVEIVFDENIAKITCQVGCEAKTGVEMEALTGASIAALTLYDMCKALSHDITIESIRLIAKTGGKRDFESEKVEDTHAER